MTSNTVYHMDDKDSGPFLLRVCGTNDYISTIMTDSITTTKGMDSKAALMFSTIEEALEVADQVWEIEDRRISIEPMRIF